MSFSPQSQDIIDKLLSGEQIESGDLCIGPIDAPTQILMKILSQDYDELSKLSGNDRANDFIKKFKSLKNEESSGFTNLDNNQLSLPDNGTIKNSSKETLFSGLRLLELCATSYRGLAPYGEEIIFPFEGKSNLIYGPNGSGKSSLLGAVIWVFTNFTLMDTQESIENADVYKPTNSGKKLRQWPANVTLPEENIEDTNPECVVSLKLISKDGKNKLWLRRSHLIGLEKSIDGEDWSSCTSLATLGIKPLDIQLSLIAPTIFGRRTIDDANESKDILQIILGFDDLLNIGELAKYVSANCTSLRNQIQGDVTQIRDDIKNKLKELPEELSKEMPLRGSIEGLISDPKLNQDKIKAVGQMVKLDIEEKEKNLLEAIGLKGDELKKDSEVGEQLILAVNKLQDDFSRNFTFFNELKFSNIKSLSGSKSPEELLDDLKKTLDEFQMDAHRRIAERLDWWRKEIEQDSKVKLLLFAAQYYDQIAKICPVCDLPIDHLKVSGELEKFKTLSLELQKEVKGFFKNLCDEFDELIDSNLRKIAEIYPNERIGQDWTLLKKTLGSVFDDLTTKYDDPIQEIADSCKVQKASFVRLLPEGTEKEFQVFGKDIEDRIRGTTNAISLLRWADKSLLIIQDSLLNLVSGKASDSLLTILSKGKEAASIISNLGRVKKSLGKIYIDQGSLTKKESETILIDEIKDKLEEIKKLKKYSENEVENIFGKIEKSTLENWKKLYPESPSGLHPGNLVQARKNVEAMLSGKDFKVPAKYFANSGLQRSIALSFYFALLDRHPGGLGFVLLDDTILSLDEDHRERWSNSIVKQRITCWQFIVSTHQRGFLNNCSTDFVEGQVVELNPRDKTGRISWRPGIRLDRAEEEMDRAYTNAPNELRKYKEELLSTLDAYSPIPFFNANDLRGSLEGFKNLQAPNPLIGGTQRKIVGVLENPVVTRVLDPGSHAITEQDISKPMVETCLVELRKCDRKVFGLLKRLDTERRPDRKARQLPRGVLIEFPQVPNSAKWNDPRDFVLMGQAAAKADEVVINVSDLCLPIQLSPGSTVCVCSGTLDPVAKYGQWVILADESVSVIVGDLAAVELNDGRRLLRRMSGEEDYWQMQSINPVKTHSVETASTAEVAIRKIIGVLYEPRKTITPELENSEWEPVDFEALDAGHSLSCIKVEGNSLEPVARPGQLVLVSEGLPIGEIKIPNGALAVVETKCEEVGNVIKRVFSKGDHFVLVSPNPVEPHDPISISADKILKIWAVRGVLFETIGD